MIGTPALLNPLRFIDTTDINNGFDGNYAINQLRRGQSPKCYFQKWQTSDTLVLQVIADTITPPSDLKFYNERGTKTGPDGIWQASTRIIQSFPDLTIYELSYSFASLPVGSYYCSFDQFSSEPICVQIEQPNTILLKYTNSENNYDMVFDTGIAQYFRVEGFIGNYRPSNERNVYVDQKHNLTQLSSVAFRKFTFYVGTSWLVPNWALDKVNFIMQCDQVAYDGIYYQPLTDAEFEVLSNPQNSYIGGAIDIEPVDNNFIKYITQPGGTGVQTFTPVQKIASFMNGSANLTVSGIFKNLTNLEKVAIYKIGADYTINIGVTPGGSEIGSFLVDDLSTIKTVEWTFLNTSNVYISGTGINYTFLYLIYKQLDEPPVPIGPATIPPPLGIGAKMLYEEITPGDLLLDFDLSTGIGDSNRDWKGWVFAGTNGTADMANRFPIGWDRVDTITLDALGGSSTITIGKTNLPAVGVPFLAATVNTSPGDIAPVGGPVARSGIGGGVLEYELRRGSGTIDRGLTANLGDGTALPNNPLSIVCLWVVKIA